MVRIKSPKRWFTLFFCIVFIASLVVSLIAVNHFQAHAQAPSNQKARPGIHADSTGDWPELHGDAARDSDQPGETLISKSNVTALAQVPGFSYNTLGSMESSPAVYQGVVYTTGMTETGSGTTITNISTMYAFNATTGAIVWSEVFPACGTVIASEWVISSPVATSGMVNGVLTPEVFVGWGSPDGHVGKYGCLYDFNALTGQLIWAFPISAHIDSSPAIMTTNNGNIVVLGDNTFFVRAFSVDYTGTIGGTGTQLWTYDDRKDVPPAGDSQFCLRAPTNCGDSVWSSPAEGLVTAGDGTLHHYAYFGTGASDTGNGHQGRIDAIDMDTLVNGSPINVWQFWLPAPTNGDDFGQVSVLNDSNGMALRVFGGSNQGHVFGLDPASGSMYFDFNASAQLGIGTEIHSNGALATINGTTELVFGSGCISSTGGGSCTGSVGHGYVWAVDAMSTNPSGTLLWQSQNFGSDIVSSPIVVNQDNNAVIFVMGPWRLHQATRGDLLALDPTNGALLADYPVFNHAYGTLSSPAVSNGHIYVTEGYTSYQNPHPTIGGMTAFACPGC